MFWGVLKVVRFGKAIGLKMGNRGGEGLAIIVLKQWVEGGEKCDTTENKEK